MREPVRAMLRETDYDRLVAALAQRRVLPLIGTRALELGADLAPEAFHAAVHAAVAAARARGLHLEVETRRVTALLAERGIPALPLKGPLLAEEAHGDLGLRDSDDVDLLVPRSRLAAAAELLIAEGYGEPADPLRANGLPDLHLALAHPRRPSVELHWRVDFHEEGFSDELLTAAEPGPDGLLRPRPADLAACLLLFHARDGLYGVRRALDVAGWWERHGHGLPDDLLEELARRHPELAPSLTASAVATERVTGAPVVRWLGSARSRSRRAAAAARLADWTQSGDRDQLAAIISLADGLLSPPGQLGAFARRELVPREGAAAPHAAKMLARYAVALAAVARGREWAPPPPEPAAVRPRVELLGMPLDPITEAEAIGHVMASLSAGRGGWMITPNLDQLRQYRRSPELRPMFGEADLLVADGMPLTWAAALAGAPLPARVAGSDLIWSLSAEAARQDRSIFLLGGAPGASDGALAMLRRVYPGMRIAGVHTPAFGFERDPAAVDAIRAELAAAQPDVVYVALGFPKQERLIAMVREVLPRAWFVGVGISFSFLAGDVARAPEWMQRAGLEWVHRLAMEPRRLARRYLVDGLPFAARLGLHALAVRARGGPPSPGPSPVAGGERVVFTHGAVERRRAEDLAKLLAELDR
jgi:N-acetylglucosaminyldiphosphoundecaprenol N-acetyl-beta-D-mannosaminyltransferase